MSNVLNPEQWERAGELHNDCVVLQTQLWHKAAELERILGCAVNCGNDLSNESLDTLCERDEPI